MLYRLLVGLFSVRLVCVMHHTRGWFRLHVTVSSTQILLARLHSKLQYASFSPRTSSQSAANGKTLSPDGAPSFTVSCRRMCEHCFSNVTIDSDRECIPNRYVLLLRVNITIRSAHVLVAYAFSILPPDQTRSVCLLSIAAQVIKIRVFPAD